MWQIQNPRKVFEYLYKQENTDNLFELVAIIPTAKYNTFPQESRAKIEALNILSISDKQVKDPNNPAKLIDVKLIIFHQSPLLKNQYPLILLPLSYDADRHKRKEDCVGLPHTDSTLPDAG